MKKMNIIYLFILTGFFFVSTTSCQKEIIIKVDNPTDKIVKFKIDNLTYKVKANNLERYKIICGEHQLIIDSDTTVINFNESKKYVLNPTRSTYIVASIIYGDYQAQKMYNVLNRADDVLNIPDKLLNAIKKFESTIKTNDVASMDTLHDLINELNNIKKHESTMKTNDVASMDTLMIDIGGGLLIPFPLSDEFKKNNSVILINNWDFGILKPLPKEIEIEKYGNAPALKTVKKIYRRQDFVNFIMDRE